MGSEWVKGSATKTNWKRRCSSRRSPSRVLFRNFSVKVVAHILQRILVTLYIYIDKNLNESTTVCWLRSLRSLSISIEYKVDNERVKQGHSLSSAHLEYETNLMCKDKP